MKNVLVPLAQGFEEAEFVGIVDVLRRAQLNVIVASLDDSFLVKGANNIEIQAQIAIKDVNMTSLDAIALAGGFEGMQNLSKSDSILKIIQHLHTNNKIVAAICASPIVLNKAGVIQGDFTCYPGCEDGLSGNRINKAVVINKNVVTSAGPATAILFGLTLVKLLCGEETYQALYEGLQVPLAQSFI
ncbi:DJ-1 family protein [Helicobacter didelphidarum]|uniref:DJ-1 family protein n=1 Tax=Helicobacter didelphidarum TaxID=2040648 RepID=A0A3D8IF34_9HELI|nr:DJ-1 family glyoxalase III [Helicobacter didelphidarum]RDU63605.1 DJ-1 family protein [Helicobacter didelphidarum]